MAPGFAPRTSLARPVKTRGTIMLTQHVSSPPPEFIPPTTRPRVTLAEPHAFGRRMAAFLRPDSAHPVQVQTLRKQRLAVTRLRCETGLAEISTPIPIENAFIVILQLRDLPAHELWFNDRPIAVGRYPEHAVSILDLEQRPSALLTHPFDCLHFHVSRVVLDEIADDHGARRVEGLAWPHGTVDPVTKHLASTILPALEQPEQTNRLFLDFAARALHAHFAQAYGGMRPAAMAKCGGLAPWQERRAKELISSRIEGDITLAELAGECRLSRSHFARAFKRTTGHSPHVWLLRRRVQIAKGLLTESMTPISEIALACGFADQSHLTKIFAKMVGVTPGAWRRACKE
jgi:AraC family transcriptional regulator